MLEHLNTVSQAPRRVVVIGAGGFVGNMICARLTADKVELLRLTRKELDLLKPDAEAFSHALEFSRFGNMKKLEAAGAFASKILQPTDVADPESFKVRRGKVGGYTDYLTGDDLAYATEAMRKLDPRFAV